MGVTVDAISAITKRKFIPKLVDQLTTSNPLLKRMPKQTLDGGTDIRQPVWYAYVSSTGWYSGTEQQATAANEKKTALVFDWKQYFVNLTISGLDKIKNAGESKVIDHVKSELEIARATLQDAFGTGIYSDGSTNTKSITGARAFLSTSNTYGGISQSSESWLQAQIDSTTTALTIGKMQELHESCTEGNDSPTIITTEATLFNSQMMARHSGDTMTHNPELRLIPRSRQDRSVNHENDARTTDKGNQNGWRYSLLFSNN